MIPTKESYVFYYSWYVWIASLNSKSQFKAFKAITEYALYDVEIPKTAFTLNEYATILTFKHVIDANKRNYQNGKKGGAAALKGGRLKKSDAICKTPTGITSEPPVVTCDGHGEYVKDNEQDHVKESVDGNANYCNLPTSTPPTFTYIYKELMPIFFFRNCNAHHEVKRFYEFYHAAKWQLTGGDRLDTLDSLIIAATRWRVEDTSHYFPPTFMSVWKDLYDMAPAELKADFLEITAPTKMQTRITVRCSNKLYQWVTIEEIQRRINWLVETKLSYSYRIDFVAAPIPTS